jgi:hypothetical protein
MDDGSVVFQYFLTIFILAAIVLPIAFLPSIIAFRKKHPNRWLILAVNGFLGPIGGLGWLLALAWSLKVIHRSPLTEEGLGSDGGESGLNIFVNDERKVRIVNEGQWGTPDKTEQLLKLKELLDSGALTKEEFETVKGEILNS